MKIIPNQDFKHGGQAFVEGEEYEVSDEEAEYFEACGWVGERTAGESVTLDVQDMMLGHSSEVN